MTEETDARAGLIDDLLEAYVRYLEGGGGRPSLQGLDATTRSEAAELFRLLDATWGSQTDLPPLEADPVAIALGFVPAPPSAPVAVAGRKMAQYRKRRGLKPSDLAERLKARGLTSSTRWVVRTESMAVADVETETVTAIAAILGCSPADLAAGDPQDSDEFITWLYSPDFDQAVADWAAEHEYRVEGLAANARSKLLAARQRSGGRADRPDWVALLRAVLNTLL